jgi:tripartite-type tricarboxylate transporter receptor subunit TctC
MSVAADIGRPMVTAPDVPADRVKALREAFAATMKDPDFLKEAAKLNVDIDPTVGEELQKLVLKVLATPKETVDRLNATVLKDM